MEFKELSAQLGTRSVQRSKIKIKRARDCSTCPVSVTGIEPAA